jgi:hypothetical protein
MSTVTNTLKACPHLNRVATGDKTVRCKNCGQILTDKRERVNNMVNIHDAIKYEWTEELARDFFYEKCHGKPTDIIVSIEQLIKNVANAQATIQTEKRILESIPF